MRIRAYTLTVNVNHAPHVSNDSSPLFTLANCKPGIRNVAKKGEWIAAITPKNMGYRLAYLMQVGDSWTREEYWQKFNRSRADSIYKPTNGGYKLLKNPFHDADNSVTDTTCNRVLWSHRFYYFAEPYELGEKTARGLTLPKKYGSLCRSMRTRYGYLIDVPNDFVEWVMKQPGKLDKLATLYPRDNHSCGQCQ